MIESAREGNLATAGIVLENSRIIASADSPVNSGNDAMALAEVGKVTHTSFKLMR